MEPVASRALVFSGLRVQKSSKKEGAGACGCGSAVRRRRSDGTGEGAVWTARFHVMGDRETVGCFSASQQNEPKHRRRAGQETEKRLLRRYRVRRERLSQQDGTGNSRTRF